MQCGEVIEQLLAGSPREPEVARGALAGSPREPEVAGEVDRAELDRHVRACARCAHVARGLRRLDGVLRSSLVVEPPTELQQRLATLAAHASQARPATADGQPSRWGPLTIGWWSRWLDALLPRPQVAAAQSLATILVGLASWQVFGWLTTSQPVIGDVPYAVEVLAASPAAVYLSGLQVDVQSLGLWSIVAGLGWLLSESGLLRGRVPPS